MAHIGQELRLDGDGVHGGVTRGGQFDLHRLARRDIANRDLEFPQYAGLGIEDGPWVGFQPDQCPILAERPVLISHGGRAGACGHIGGYDLLGRLHVIRMHEGHHGCPDQLLGLVPQYVRHGGRQIGEAPVGTVTGDEVARVLGQQPIAGLTLGQRQFGFFAFGDIAKGADDFTNRAIVIPDDRRTALDPAIAVRLGLEPILAAHAAIQRLAAEVVAHRRSGGGEVIGMDEGGDVRSQVLARLIPESPATGRDLKHRALAVDPDNHVRRVVQQVP